jgi:hypothetical protein
VKHISKEHLSKETVAEYNARGSNFNLTLAGLKEFVDNAIANGVNMNTMVAIDHLEDSLFDRVKNNGWNLIDYLWEADKRHDSDEIDYSYCCCVPTFQIFTTKDLNDDALIVITPHY